MIGVTGGSPFQKKLSAEGLTTIAHSFGVGGRLFMPNGGSVRIDHPTVTRGKRLRFSIDYAHGREAFELISTLWG
jgi:hypothetical protein